MSLLRFLLHGSDVMHLPSSWLRSVSYCEARYYTLRQLEGRIVKDVAATRREEFWDMIAEKRKPKSADVLRPAKFGRGA